MRREVRQYMQRNKWWIILGIILTVLFIKVAYMERGYMAYGGEWLTVPMILLVLEVVRNTKDAIENLKN